MSHVAYKLVGLLCVDDTCLVALNNGNACAHEIVEKAQALLDKWQFALNITGGGLKHENYFCTIQNCS